MLSTRKIAALLGRLPNGITPNEGLGAKEEKKQPETHLHAHLNMPTRPVHLNDRKGLDSGGALELARDLDPG